MGAVATASSADDRLDEVFGALSNATRRSILAHLATGEATVKELAAPFEMTLPAISRHIKVLERAGLISRGQRAQYRPCAIEAAPIREVLTWAEQYRPIWTARFDRMDAHLQQIQSPQDDDRQEETPND